MSNGDHHTFRLSVKLFQLVPPPHPQSADTAIMKNLSSFLFLAGRCFAHISKQGTGIWGQIHEQQKILVFVAYCCSTADAVYQLCRRDRKKRFAQDGLEGRNNY